jgi:acetylornithine deacetylase/succinyl-diaminopimelate desuccinylase-like protein
VNQPKSNFAQEMLCDLVALKSVNPMGRPYSGVAPVERPVVEYLERRAAAYDVETRRMPCSAIHENLLIAIPGATDAPGTLFESHADTVPADDWADLAFSPRVSQDRIYGRGACDDKASLAAMIVAAIELLESKCLPPQPVWILVAADEEYAQTGIRTFLDRSPPSLGRAVFGEPTDLSPVIQHKGTLRWDITVTGRSAHTSQAEHGRNAIVDMTRVIQCLAEHDKHLKSQHHNALLTGPSISVTMIEGGRTRNMVPDQCKVAVDFRVLPEMDMQRSFDDVAERLDSLHLKLEHSDFQCFAPPLNTSPDNAFAQRVLGFCRAERGHEMELMGVPYGSDAVWTPPHVSTIVLGPGNIAQAHAVDEFVELPQVAHACAIYRSIMETDWR